MSWRLAYQSTKLLFSYLFPYKIRLFRDAIFAGDVATIRTIIAERPKFIQQAVDGDGNTALGLAILVGQVDVIKTLFELGGNPNLANVFDGNHPLVLLARVRTEENYNTGLLAELLLNAGSDPLSEVRYQADTSTRFDATQTPSFHETPLLCSIRYQNEELLKKMIEHRVNINTLNPETGTSALMLAAALGYRNMCNILIDAGADINAADYTGNTPLHRAVQGYGERIPIIQTLLQRGANVNITNEDGFTPAMLAKRSENDACYKLLSSPTNNPISPPAYQEFNGVKEEPKDQNIFSFT